MNSRAAAGIAQMNVDFIGLSPPKAARVVVIAISAFAAGARLFILLAGGARIMTTLGDGINRA
jgi:hypothetical protein